jgi:serine/threonine protein kinase
LGQGGQGAVYLAVDRSNSQEKVVKYYDKSCANAPADDIIDEFALLTKLDHPKIARTYEIFQDTANFYVVSEPYFGGDLSTAVEKAQKAGVGLTEKWFADIWRQSMEGVAFLHTQHTMHCDIKEPNIMISSKDNFQSPNVVVIDFGLAQGFGAGSMPGGTPGYMPPEVWQCGLWTPKGDTFAMGVTFYSMITMQGSPFVRGATSIDHVKMITMQCRLPPPSGHLASPQGRALNTMITRMLSRDFHSRPTMAQVLQDPWMRQASGGAMEIDRSAIRRMTQVHDMSLLQKGLLADMASRENLAQLEELSATFTSMDSDNDGMVSKDEARTALRKSGLGSAEIEKLIETLIGDQGSVSYTVFMGQLIAAKKGDSVNTLRQIFQQYDADSNGYLDQREIREMLSQPAILDAFPKGKTAEAILKEYGWDKMRKVTWEDFRHAFENEVSPENTNSQYKKGDSVEYYSPSYGKWVQCVVTEERDDGAIQVNVKPGFWFAMRDQGSKIRKSGAGTAASPGQALLAAALGF